jgi:hypothetical protein
MVGRGKHFFVDTSPTKEVVVSSLTRDASVEACIFDLIDNSIDAARNSTFHITEADEEHILLDSYKGFSIALNLSGEGLKIEDNCGGIPVARLKTSVLRFGEPSTQHMGIGVFGVGLNRALFKIGRRSEIDTDTGEERSVVVLDNAEYLKKKDDWDLPAEKLPTDGRIGTTIQVESLPPDISKNFADPDWVKGLRTEIGSRYGRFLEKGLIITVNGLRVESRTVPFREGGPFDEEYKVYRASNGVSVHIRYGEHRDHRFKKEPDHDLARNRALTDEYGWTVYCNDRAILISNKEWKTGWDSFHTEFYGFVGEVSFVGADPGALPWNTTKTDVDLNNTIYQDALEDMRRFNGKWRQFSDQRKKATDLLKPIPPAPPKKPDGFMEDSGRKPSSGSPGPRPQPQPVRKPPAIHKPDHNETRFILPADLDEHHLQDKHLALVHEGKDLDLFEFPYAGLALMRMLFEVSVREFARRHGLADALQTFAISHREKGLGRPLNDKQKRDLTPSFDEALAFIEANPSFWGTKSGALKSSVGQVGKNQGRFNSALHNTWQTIHKSEAFRIRDDIGPILRHLIEI